MRKIGFLGAGNMAFAIAGAISEKYDDAVIVPFDINRERLDLFTGSFRNVKPAASAEELGLSCDVLFLAVKPQMMKEAASPLAGYKVLLWKLYYRIFF